VLHTRERYDNTWYELLCMLIYIYQNTYHVINCYWVNEEKCYIAYNRYKVIYTGMKEGAH
jgi:hypothetical protein